MERKRGKERHFDLYYLKKIFCADSLWGRFPENFESEIKSSAQNHTDSLKEMKFQLAQRRERAIVPTKAVG